MTRLSGEMQGYGAFGIFSAFGLQSAGGWAQARPHMHAHATATTSNVLFTGSPFERRQKSASSASVCACIISVKCPDCIADP